MSATIELSCATRYGCSAVYLKSRWVYELDFITNISNFLTPKTTRLRVYKKRQCYQPARNAETVTWCFHTRSDRLTNEEINWLMEMEKNALNYIASILKPNIVWTREATYQRDKEDYGTELRGREATEIWRWGYVGKTTGWRSVEEWVGNKDSS